MNELQKLLSQAEDIESRLGYVFENKMLLVLAFVHRSYVNEHRDVTEEHNERLEFLGDSVLGLMVSEFLYSHFPQTPEGELSHLRSQLVDSASCFQYMNSLDLESYLLLGRGERLNDGRGRDSILANTFESLLGAIFLDGGIASVKEFFFRTCSSFIHETIDKPVVNWKAELQDYAQKNYQKMPEYRLIDQYGPDHSKIFRIAVYIEERELGIGQGASKKEAQQAAAEQALLNVNQGKCDL